MRAYRLPPTNPFTGEVEAKTNMAVEMKLPRSVYNLLVSAKNNTMDETTAIWIPVPTKLANKDEWGGERKTSPCTCFQPYSSPNSRSWKNSKKFGYLFLTVFINICILWKIKVIIEFPYIFLLHNVKKETLMSWKRITW